MRSYFFVSGHLIFAGAKQLHYRRYNAKLQEISRWLNWECLAFDSKLFSLFSFYRNFNRILMKPPFTGDYSYDRMCLNKGDNI